MKKRRTRTIIITAVACLAAIVASVCFWKFAGTEKGSPEPEAVTKAPAWGSDIPEGREPIQTERLETSPGIQKLETEQETPLPEPESGLGSEIDSLEPGTDFSIEIKEEQEQIRKTFLKVEPDLRSLVSYRAGLFNPSGLVKLAFQEKLSESGEELSFRIQLFFSDGSMTELAASYHKEPAYPYLETMEEFEKRKQEEEDRKEYLFHFQPSVTEEKQGLKAYLGDLEAFVRETGTYLYEQFGKVKISEIRLEYLLREEPVEIRLSLIEENGDQTPFSCTYFAKTKQYFFDMVEVYD